MSMMGSRTVTWIIMRFEPFALDIYYFFFGFDDVAVLQNFAPRCFSCKTAIIEERFISLDDPALGKRAYHEQHFFCAECGDPFLAPSMNNSSRSGELSVQGDGEFESDDVGFTVYKGHPYCEACHVRLRLPKCKRCKKSIRDHEQAVEALGGKWCWGCFVCAVSHFDYSPSVFYIPDVIWKELREAV